MSKNTKRKPLSELWISQGQKLMKCSGTTDFVVHAPYIINPYIPSPINSKKTISPYKEEIALLRNPL